MQADGALERKLNAYVRAQEVWAAAYSKRPVPSLVMGGGTSSTDQSGLDFSQALQLLVAKDLGLDLGVMNGSP